MDASGNWNGVTESFPELPERNVCCKLDMNLDTFKNDNDRKPHASRAPARERARLIALHDGREHLGQDGVVTACCQHLRHQWSNRMRGFNPIDHSLSAEEKSVNKI